MNKSLVETSAAPRAIGTYSQAIKSGNTVYLSGQIPLSAQTMEIVSAEIRPQVVQVFDNLRAVAAASQATLDHAVKLTVYLTDLAHFPIVNEVMARYFPAPFPARATVQVTALPRGALIEIDAILIL